eukprot:jgi/Bigna1/69380/fgenesh1_pg.8_\
MGKRRGGDDTGHDKESTNSVAWDWIFEGATAKMIEKDTEKALTNARYNQREKKSSLGIVNTCSLRAIQGIVADLTDDANENSHEHEYDDHDDNIDDNKDIRAEHLQRRSSLYNEKMMISGGEQDEEDNGRQDKNMEILRGLYPIFKTMVKKHMPYCVQGDQNQKNKQHQQLHILKKQKETAAQENKITKMKKKKKKTNTKTTTSYDAEKEQSGTDINGIKNDKNNNINNNNNKKRIRQAPSSLHTIVPSALSGDKKRKRNRRRAAK